MINVAIVGVGYWGQNLARNLNANANINLLTICDRDLIRAHWIAQQYCPSASLCSDIRSIIADPKIDAIALATPIATHYQLASIALKAGKHVLVEKPLAKTVDECSSLIDLAESRNLVLMVGHVFEFNNAVLKIKEYLDAGEIGRVFYIHGQRLNLGRIQAETNALWSFAPHDISIVNLWLGLEPVAVSARGFSFLNNRIEDVVFMTLEYPQDVAVNLNFSWLDPRKLRLITIVGSQKMIVYDDVSLDAKISIHDKGADRLSDFLEAPSTFAHFQYKIRNGDVLVPALDFSEPLAEECAHFAACVESGARPRTDGLNGLRVVKVLEAAQRSLTNQGHRFELG